MSAKIYTVWGGNNSGKTTFAVNLACALARQDKLVGLISSNLICGELQTYFGEGVSAEKGIFEALIKESPNIGEMFSECGQSKNLFYLCVPTLYSGLLCDTVGILNVERLLNSASLVFDMLIIDGASEINNPISSVGLWLADRIFILHRPSIRAQLWYRSVSEFIRELHIGDKQIHILRTSNGDFDDRLYQTMTELPFPWELPYVKRAGELENAGTPLYFFRDRSCRRYSKVLGQIAHKICGGGKP